MSDYKEDIHNLTPLEHLFLAGERPQHSVCFFIIVRCVGLLVQDRFEEAVRGALSRHPMLRVKIKGDPALQTSQLHWATLSDVSGTLVHWNPKQIFPINIFESGGVQISVCTKEDGSTEMFFQFHPAAVDPRGGIQFIEDVLTIYAGRSEALIGLDNTLLAGRGSSSHEGVSHKFNMLGYAEQYAGFLLQKSAPLASRTHATGEYNAEHWPCYRSHSFEQADFRRIKSRTIQKHCTVNDILLRDLFLAIDAWNQEYGVKQSVCLQMGINLRTVADSRMPAAVHGSFCNIARSRQQMRDGWLLLDSIRRETTSIKENHLGYAVPVLAGMMAKIKGGMQLLLRMRKSQAPSATACVMNLGEVFRYSPFGKAHEGYLHVGTLRILDVQHLPPIRPGLKVSFGLVTCQRRLTVTMHYDQTALSHEDARVIFEMVTDRVRETAGDDSVSGEDLKALIQRHKSIAAHSPGFRSLPLGKNVATGVRLEMSEGKPGHGTVEQLH